MHVTAIIAAGGAGRRFGASVPKQLLDVGGRTILERSVTAFTSHPRVGFVVVALPRELLSAPPAWLSQLPRVMLVAGGDSRQASVAAAFDSVPATTEIVLVHDAARPFVSTDVIDRCIDAAAAHGGAIAALPASDTVKRVMPGGVIAETIPRDAVYLAQTPQAFRRELLAQAVALGRSGAEATDEAALAERAGQTVRVVQGDPANIKITTPEDLQAGRRGGHSASSRIGIGYDLHRLVEGRPLIIGGVQIPFERGAEGHSDADVACHAVTDAILGAASLGDIGMHFPDSDAQWRGASSVELLRTAAAKVRASGFTIGNIDVAIVLERPKIAPYKDAIRKGLADALGIPPESVSVKGKTNEGMDAIGRGEAVAAHAAAFVTSNF